jgi:signal transduction histidine kinase
VAENTCMSASAEHASTRTTSSDLRLELEIAQREVIRLRSAQRDFVADTIHDLRSPLAATIGAVELLADGQGLSEFQRRELIAMTRRALARLRSAMDDLLAGADTGRLETAEAR